MVRSLISQLYYKQDNARKELDSIFSTSSAGHPQPTIEFLCMTLVKMIQQVNEVWIVLDALDECHTRKGRSTEGLLSWMESLQSTDLSKVHLLITSRQEEDIESAIAKWARAEDIIPIQGSLISNDIRAYIHTRVREDDGLKRWRSRPDVQEEIESELMEKADGM